MLLTRLLAIVAFSASAIGAQESKLPDAAAVAIRINQRVTFQDTVTAVSHSRTRDGFYLNFGAPYPKQVLSIWVTDKIGKGLPGLIGRTVRVDGVVQSSQTGPMINLESRDQLQLLPVDESILSKAQIGGRTDRREFITALRQLLDRQDFDTIEVLGNELQQSHERFTDGTWMLDAFFAALDLGPGASTKTYDERRQILANWEKRYPASILPILAHARYHVNLAWKWRGVSYASKVTNEGWKHFRAELAEARQVLENNPQAKASLDYYVEMQTVALGQNWKKDDYFRLFSEAVNREPEYFRFYFQAAYYLQPKWHGKKGEWEKFAEEQRQKFGGAIGDMLYTRIAWSQADEYRHHLFDKTAISWETMAAGFDALLRQYPDNYNKNAYAHFAWEAEDRARLRFALDAIRQSPDMEIWVNLENFQFAEKFANSPPGQ